MVTVAYMAVGVFTGVRAKLLAYEVLLLGRVVLLSMPSRLG
jgi:hypothetical protein